MFNSLLSENLVFAVGLAQSTNLCNGTPSTDVIHLGNFRRAAFIITTGNEGTGTFKIEAFAADNVAGNNPVAIPFRYRVGAIDGSGLSDVEDVAASGKTTTANTSGRIRIVELVAPELPQGKPCAFLTLTQVAAGNIPGAVNIVGGAGRYPGKVQPVITAALGA